jgi:hypothetical protein
VFQASVSGSKNFRNKDGRIIPDQIEDGRPAKTERKIIRPRYREAGSPTSAPAQSTQIQADDQAVLLAGQRQHGVLTPSCALTVSC